MQSPSVVQSVRKSDTIRLSEILGALSHALDLTEGQPPGHCVRATWIGMAVGRAMGLDGPMLWELYHTVMMKDLGCSSNAARICQLYGAERRDDMSAAFDAAGFVADLCAAGCRVVLSTPGTCFGPGDRAATYFIGSVDGQGFGEAYSDIMLRWHEAIENDPDPVGAAVAHSAAAWEAGT